MVYFYIPFLSLILKRRKGRLINKSGESGKMPLNPGYEKRCEARTKKEIPVVFVHKKRNLDACTVNYSKNGLGIKIFRKVALPVGNIIDLKTRNSSTKAQVMWTKKEIDPPITLIGLKVVDGKLNLKGQEKTQASKWPIPLSYEEWRGLRLIE